LVKDWEYLSRNGLTFLRWVPVRLMARSFVKPTNDPPKHSQEQPARRSRCARRIATRSFLAPDRMFGYGPLNETDDQPTYVLRNLKNLGLNDATHNTPPSLEAKTLRATSVAEHLQQ
jgi:hypothetical protein